MKKITLLFCLTLLTNLMSAQCLTATSSTPQYPTTTYTPTTCDGVTVNSITPYGYASEYSEVTVTLGQQYVFGSSIATDLITISADGGTTAVIWGVGSVTWTSTLDGTVRFYTHLNDGACGGQNSNRTRTVVCGTPPSCVAPTALVSSNLTTTSATISWTASTTNPANGYDYYLSTTNSAPTSTSTPTGTVGAGIVTTDLSGLTPATIYYVWVRSNCSSTDTSVWLSGTFSTLALPPVCGGNFLDTGGSSANYSINEDYTTTICPTNTGDLVTVTFTSFYTEANYDGLYVYDGDSTSAPLIPSANGAGTNTALNTPGAYWGNLTTPPGPFTASNTTGCLTFRFISDGSITYSGWTSNITCAPAPTCVIPTVLSSSNITDSSATISWNASISTPANGYDYYVSTTTTAPDGTTTPTGSVAAGTTTANLTGLSAATTYYVWVRSNCSSTDTSAWTSSISFSTTCALLTTFSEDFESTTGTAFPNCWAKVGTTGSSNTQASTGIAGARNLYIYSTSSTNRAVVSMPAVSNAADGTQQFTAKVRGNFTAGDTLEFGYLTNPSDASTFVALGSIVTNSTTVAQDFLVSPVTTPSGITTLALRHAGLLGYSILVDNVYYGPALSNASFDSKAFSVYPNPVKDVLNIGYSGTITNISITNLLGQEMLTKTINADQSQINVSNLVQGTYLVKVTAENGSSKTIKIIKE